MISSSYSLKLCKGYEIQDIYMKHLKLFYDNTKLTRDIAKDIWGRGGVGDRERIYYSSKLMYKVTQLVVYL